MCLLGALITSYSCHIKHVPFLPLALLRCRKLFIGRKWGWCLALHTCSTWGRKKILNILDTFIYRFTTPIPTKADFNPQKLNKVGWVGYQLDQFLTPTKIHEECWECLISSFPLISTNYVSWSSFFIWRFHSKIVYCYPSVMHWYDRWQQQS